MASKNTNDNNSNNDGFESNKFNDNNSESSTSNTSPEFDIGTILKMKKIMDSMNSNKNDPRSNLLLSLKPYLKHSRQDKVDQYIKLFNMSKVLEVINPMGGDNKNGL